MDADTAHLTSTQTFTGSKTMATDVKLNFRDANSHIFSKTANDLSVIATDIVLDAATSVKIESKILTMYDPVNDGNPTISLGSSATNRFEIKTAYNSGAQTLDEVYFNSYTTSTSTNDGRFIFQVDEVELARLFDTGLSVYGSVFAQSAGAKITSLNTTASSATQGGTLSLRCDDGAAMESDDRLGVVQFEGAEDSSSNRQIGASIQAMCDAAWSASENGTRLEFYTMDGNASSELSLTLDSDLLASFAGNIAIAGDRITAAGDLGLIAVGNDITVDSDTLTITSSTADQPIVKLLNTTNDDQASQIVFEKLRADNAVAQGQNLGEIWFKGQDAAQNTEDYAYIVGEIDVSTSGQESGSLTLGVASHDGSNRTGFKITGGDTGEVDVNIGLGSSSITTIVGTLTMGSTAAMGNTGLLTVGAQTGITAAANLVTVGTIGTGVWNGDVIASAYLDADTAHLAGAQTFTGTKTLNSFKGTGGATVTNILDEDAMGSNSATALATQQSIKAYADRPAGQIFIKQGSFAVNAGTSIVFFPMTGTAENTSANGISVPMLAPVNGKLLKVHLRSNKDHSAGNQTFTLTNWDNNETFTTGNASTLGAKTVTGVAANNVIVADFQSSLDSDVGGESNAFTVGETIGIGMTNAVGGLGSTKYWFTAVFEFDFSGY